MAETITVVGVADDKPLTHEVKSKVQNALKAALTQELARREGIVSAHHYSISHTSIVFEQA
jgi:hypothetical protein